MDGPRACTEAELDETLAMLDLVFRVNRGEPPGMAQIFPFLSDPVNVERMRIIKEDGGVVSHIVIWPITMTIEGIPFTVGGLGTVGTHPDYRGRGYSTLLLKHCVEVMESEGCDFSVLWTGIADFYRRVGWEHGGRELSYVIPRARAEDLPRLSGCVVGWNPSDEDWQTLDLIRPRMPVSTIRTPEWTRRYVEARRSLVLMARRRGKLAAYTINRGNEVFEFGGEAEDVAGLIRLRFDWFHGLTQLSLQRIPPGPFASYLDRLGLERKEAPLGMLRLIHPEQVLQRLGVEGVAVRKEGAFTVLKYAGREARLDPRQLVKFFFTSDADVPPRPKGLPVFPYCWVLDHV